MRKGGNLTQNAYQGCMQKMYLFGGTIYQRHTATLLGVCVWGGGGGGGGGPGSFVPMQVIEG